jgi:FtsH-binding integral membrane protein
MENNENNQQNQYQYNNQQYQPNGAPLEPSMTLGNWLLIMLLVSIPCVNIILLLLWSFGRDVSITKKNYSRAMLIFMVIGLVIGLIFSSIFATIFSSIGADYYY